MNNQLKAIFATLMLSALMFGFLHLFIPAIDYNFERLHIFLFNLCSGCTILLYFTEKKKQLSIRVLMFLVLSLAYAVFAFFKLYIPAIIIAIALAVIVESVRIKTFSAFPIGFFSTHEPVYKKFHQASLLCLSIGLIISCLVIANNEYLKLIYMPKLKLDTFFLGFSFPLSLITMSIMFSLMSDNVDKFKKHLKEFGFWTVNLGVIIFFIFIIFEKLIPQVFITTILFFAVMGIYYLYQKDGKQLQQKNFLTSGMLFLLVTAVTGILYIIFEFLPGYTSEDYKWLLRLHSFAALYGWNLCGLAIICRYDDFPIKLHSKGIIFLHWLTVIILAPLGSYYSFVAVMATISYAVVLYIVLFSKGTPSSVA